MKLRYPDDEREMRGTSQEKSLAIIKDVFLKDQ